MEVSGESLGETLPADTRQTDILGCELYLPRTLGNAQIPPLKMAQSSHLCQNRVPERRGTEKAPDIALNGGEVEAGWVIFVWGTLPLVQKKNYLK